ncbi:forkhead box protein R1 [Dendropsophus ebraccatus]|uniref:forkhead box protein R1 n=1 Tax=Dendropsophus ebraccatus TaxID=150705 RepID=UPI0038313BAA
MHLRTVLVTFEEQERMYLRFSDRSRYENLHLTTALEDWDMTEEMKQCLTIDQYFIGRLAVEIYLRVLQRDELRANQWLRLGNTLIGWAEEQEAGTLCSKETGAEEKVDRYSLKRQQSTELSPSTSAEGSPQECNFHPTLWLIVDPNVVMQCPEPSTPLPPDPHVTSSYKSFNPDNKTRSSVDCSTNDDSDDDALTSSSELLTEDDHCFISSLPSTCIQRVSSQKYKKGQVQKSLTSYETWPRPPLNYCNLISLALRNSEDGSLNVQQIYSFVREHFPFFRAAPDGWKNTVRHNLCFSSSFEKSAGWVCADGPRRSCLWKLTRQGRRKFRTEMHALSDELVRVLRRSMNKPALMELMFGM